MELDSFMSVEYQRVQMVGILAMCAIIASKTVPHCATGVPSAWSMSFSSRDDISASGLAV